MTKSSTHPDNAFGSQDAISIEDFNRTITDAYYREHHSTSKKQPYREVRVLCFHFDTDDGGAYCDKVKDVFSQGFGFRVATCRLPCTDTAQREMITALEEAFDGIDSDCLVIIYYIGHGVNKHDHLGNMHFCMEGKQIGQKPP